MTSPRRARTFASHRSTIEMLESRTLLSSDSWSDVLTSDAYLSSSEVPSDTDGAVNSVPNGGPATGVNYTIRALVEYYNDTYAGSSTEPFTIALAPNTTYTLSDTDNPSSIYGGRDNETNEYGALDVNPLHTTAPLIITGGPGTVLTCTTVGSTGIPLDRLVHIISGSVELQGVSLKGGEAKDNGTGTQGSDALGGGVLVNPGGSLSLTNCALQSNKAVASTYGIIGVGGFNAAGAGVYGSAGSVLSITGSTTFTNNQAYAGDGGTSTGPAGLPGGNAFGGGLAMAADVSEPSAETASETLPATELSLTDQSGSDAISFVGNTLNASTTGPNKTVAYTGGTGGAGSITGGAGGNAYGGGLYMGSGQLNINGGSPSSPLPVQFEGNLAAGGKGYFTDTTPNLGVGGSAFGGGACITPGQVFITDPTSSGGILQFTANTSVSYTGYTTTMTGSTTTHTPTTTSASSGLYLPPISNTSDLGYTIPEGPWTLRTAIADANALASTGMNLTLTLQTQSAGVDYTLTSANTGTDIGSLLVSSTGSGSLTINGGGASSTVINGADLGTSVFAFSNATVKLANLSISNANSTVDGGAISARTSVATITKASLINNASANDGGGIYQYGGTLRVVNSTLTSNKATSSGGAAYIDVGSTFSVSGTSTISNNDAGFDGGGVYAHNSGVSFSGTSITDNSAGNDGGGITEQAGELTIAGNTQLQGNSASVSGGGILVDGACAFTMLAGKISQNSAMGTNGEGGGIHASSAASVKLTSVGISGNMATSSTGVGGGIYQSTGTISVKNSTISDNESFQGGGIAVAGASLVIAGGSVVANTLKGNNSGNGAGVYAVSNAVVNIHSVNVLSNVASSAGDVGGGLYQDTGTLNITGVSTIKNNRASEGAGAFLDGGAVTEFNGVTISGNVAAAVGGGVYDWGCNVHATNALISSNQVESGSTITGIGGGIYQNGGGSIALSGSTVVANNSAADGGGIVCETAAFTANGTVFRKNKATAAGAGFYSTSNTHPIDFTNVKLSSNQIAAVGTAYGGGLYLTGGTLNADGITVQGNQIQAANDQPIEGAGIYASGETINLNGGSGVMALINENALTGNGSGQAYGAGICLASGSLVDNSLFTFTNNKITQTTDGVGGGIAFFQSTKYTSSYATTASGNSADAGGNDYAFTVTSFADNNNGYSTGPNGINDFTDGAGSLRSAISYAESYMANNPNNQSMAIMLSGGSYNVTDGQLVINLPSGESLTLIDCTGGTAITGNQTSRIFQVNSGSGDSGTVVFQNIQIQGGHTGNDGGAINLAAGTLWLNGDVVVNNSAGPTGVAQPNYTSGKSNPDGNDNGANGGTGTSGYGGGIYMSGGALNVLANTSITANTVYGQNGGAGQKGGHGSISETFWGECNNGKNGGNGGNGGSGGNALGGGLYIAGGTLNIPDNSSIFSKNVAKPGSGGAAGAGGAQGTSSAGWHTSNGSNGSNGSGGTGVPTYALGGANTVFMSANASSAALVVSGGLYGSAGTLNTPSAVSAAVLPANVENLGRVSGITVDLFSSDGTLVATARTDSSGTYHFDSNFSGMGYIQVQTSPIFDVIASGAGGDPGQASTVDPVSGRSGVVQFVAGVPVNEHLSVLLSPIATTFQTGPNSVTLSKAGGGPAVWSEQIAPRGYTGGFDVTRFDVNGDGTPDYLLLTKKGTPKLFFVDGRTGAVTAIGGAVSSSLRRGMAVLQAHLEAGDNDQLILYPSGGRSGPVSMVDVQAERVMWTSNTWVPGGMNVVVDGSGVAGRADESDIGLNSIRYGNAMKILNGQTGKPVKYVKLNTKSETPSTRMASRSSLRVDYRPAVALKSGADREAASRSSSAVGKKARVAARSPLPGG